MTARESLDVADWLFEYRWQQYRLLNTYYFPPVVKDAIANLIDRCSEAKVVFGE